jgi:hypothetical protein
MAAAAAPAEGEGSLAFLARPPEGGGRRHGVGRLGSRVLGTERGRETPTEGRGESVGG